MTTRPSYYLAGSFVRRESLRDVRTRINTAFPNWDCSARWLDIESEADEHIATIALIDAHDVLCSDALVFVRGQPYSPGKHTELGLAIASAIPIHVVTAEWTTDTEPEPCIFLELLPPAMLLDTWVRTGVLETTPARQTNAAKLLAEIRQYGIDVPGTRGVVTPYTGLSLAEGAGRTVRAGTRWNLAPGAVLGLEGSREEGLGGNAPTESITFRTELRW